MKDSLVFMTARYNLAVVSYDSESGEVVTRAFGNIKVGINYSFCIH